ncbi:MAG: T9SS type A sorting domain-containing protein [Saprospiraceae bacterium]|nr:T9SS type A sorting domain-containing protein [Saprospiraceae bacterium]
MNTHILLLLGLIWHACLSAQNFITPFYFQDSLEHRDTVWIGFDPNGNSEQLTEYFSEINLIDSPKSNDLEVRITRDVNVRIHPGIIDTTAYGWETKLKIQQGDCSLGIFPDYPYWDYFRIEIKTDAWPVRVTWDSLVFADSCIRSSYITDWHAVTDPFDYAFGVEEIIDPVKYELGKHGSLVLTNLPSRTSEVSFLNRQGEPVKVIYLILLDQPAVREDLARSFDFTIEYGSAQQVLISHDGTPWQSLRIYDLQGRLLKSSSKATEFDVSELPLGQIYFWQAFSGVDNTTVSGKFSKN